MESLRYAMIIPEQDTAVSPGQVKQPVKHRQSYLEDPVI